MDTQNFEQLSYQAHANWYQQRDNQLERIENKNTINYWREERMLSMLEPFLDDSKKWLTVGDGVGTDAHWLKTQGQNAMASDINDSVLKVCLEKGYIDAQQKENVEKLSFADKQFDYVLCKEAYHHFPRPYLGVYEMLRVSSEAIVLIEPIDMALQMPFLLYLKNVLDKLNVNYINKFWKNRYSFEPVGNYVYKLSEREMEKLAMGINLPAVAFGGLNDYYTTKFDLSQPPENKKIFRKVKSKIFRKNILSKLGILPYGVLTCVIFTKLPTQEQQAKLKAKKYKYIELPKNPYL